eukprot:6514111-Lingulodinium_polyedra.AAC.1
MMRLRSLSVAATARILRASHAPRGHQQMASAWRARRAQNVSRCGGGQRLQPHHCATFAKRCTMMWLNRPFAAPTARRTRAS